LLRDTWRIPNDRRWQMRCPTNAHMRSEATKVADPVIEAAAPS